MEILLKEHNFVEGPAVCGHVYVQCRVQGKKQSQTLEQWLNCLSDFLQGNE